MEKIKLPNKYLTSILIGVLAVNQFALIGAQQTMGMTDGGMLMIFSTNEAYAMEIMMPIPNDDGSTTHLQMMPTITEVPGEPNSGDVVADAMQVMIATGTPFYAPDGISFDDPIGSLSTWNKYNSVELSADLEDRYNRLISVFPCNFCCGSATDVTMNGRCGCAHAKAGRGFFRYMLSQYGDTYSDDELFGEAYKWQAIWYPSGVVEDYLLATGRSDVLGHDSHGGAGADGMHGM